jgi:hypothetical protein
LFEESGDFLVAFAFGEGERRLSVIEARRRIGAVIEKHLHQPHIAICGGGVER